MIAITGAAGFIGSCLVGYLNEMGEENLLLVDDFSPPAKRPNWEGKKYRCLLERAAFPDWLERNGNTLQAVVHLGARTDTTLHDERVFQALNLTYSQALWKACAHHEIPFIYASSAATYGDGSLGFQDDHALVERLQPLNPYGRSKNDFDRWVLQQPAAPPRWAGLKFFNVYGPNEAHKQRMASVVYHTFRQIRQTGRMRLFRSHRPDFRDGEQRRDFVFVEDVLRVCRFFLMKEPPSGLYNVGTGRARTFLDLAGAVFRALELEPAIEFIPTPEDIRDTYQYFTEAPLDKLRRAGYEAPFTSLEAGVETYVRDYLLPGRVR